MLCFSRHWAEDGCPTVSKSTCLSQQGSLALLLGTGVIGPVWVRCSFLVQSAKAERAGLGDLTWTMGPLHW